MYAGSRLSPVQQRLRQAECRYVRNAQRQGAERRKCKISFEQLLELFRSDLLMTEISKILKIAEDTVCQYYENYVREFCDDEPPVSRARRILDARRNEHRAHVLQSPWPPLVRKVADLALAAGCEVEPVFVNPKMGLALSHSLLRINGRLCYLHHIQRIHKGTGTQQAASIPLDVRAALQPEVEFRIVHATPPGYGARTYGIPQEILLQKRFWYIRIGRRAAYARKPVVSLEEYLNVWPPKLPTGTT